MSPLSSGKIDKYEYLTGEEILSFNPRQVIKQAKFAYSLLEKALEKQSEKQVDALKPLDLSNQTVELKKIKGIFPKKSVERFDYFQIKKITHLQGIIKSNELDYISKCKKTCNFSKYALPVVF